MSLKCSDPEIYKLIKEEEKRQKNTLNLIASENYASQATLQAQASVTANKLGEGYIGKRWSAGCEVIDKIEKLAIERAKILFGAEHVNVQCPTATQANVAVYAALLQQGDTVLSPSFRQGGHFSHGTARHISGKFYKFYHYGLSRESEQFDFENIEKIALERKPKLIIAGMSAYPRLIDFFRFKEVANKIGAILMADIAHVAGLVIAGLHPNPFPHADVVTTSTHKTFRGPRGGGIILCKNKYADAIDEGVYPGTQGTPVMSIIASRAVLFKEAMSPKFVQYQKQIVENAKVLAEVLAKNDIRIVTGGTDNHMIIIDLKRQKLTGDEAEALLYSVGIVTNKILIPFDEKPQNITSGLRLGTVPLTTRGMKKEEMEKIGTFVSDVLLNPGEKSVLVNVKKQVRSCAKKFPLFSEEWK